MSKEEKEIKEIKETKFLFFKENLKKLLLQTFQNTECKLKVIENNQLLHSSNLENKTLFFDYTCEGITKKSLVIFLESNHTYTSLEKFMNIISLYTSLKLDYLLVIARYNFSEEIKEYIEINLPDKIHLLEADFLQGRYFDSEIKKIDPNFRHIRNTIIRNDAVDFEEELTYQEMENVKDFFHLTNEKFVSTFYLLDKFGNKVSISDYNIDFIKNLDKDIKYGSIDLSDKSIFIQLPNNIKKKINKIYIYYFIDVGLNLEEAFTALFINTITSSLSYDFIINKDFKILSSRQKIVPFLDKNSDNPYDKFILQRLNSLQIELGKNNNLATQTKQDVLKNIFADLKSIHKSNDKLKDNFSKIISTMHKINDKIKDELIGKNLQFPANVENILDNNMTKLKEKEPATSVKKTTKEDSKKVKITKTTTSKKPTAKNTDSVKKEIKAAVKKVDSKIKKETKKISSTISKTLKPVVKEVKSISKKIEKQATPIIKDATKKMKSVGASAEKLLTTLVNKVEKLAEPPKLKKVVAKKTTSKITKTTTKKK